MTDDQIYKYLCGNIDVGDMYLSPIPSKYRKPDTNNSFGLYMKDGDPVIRWKDYGLSNQEGYTAIHLYQYMMGFPLDYKGFLAAKSHAEKEIPKYFRGKPVVELQKNKYNNKKDLCPYVEYDSNFSDFELEYWDRYYLAKEDLLAENIFSLKKLKWLNYSTETKSIAGDPAFIYIFDKNPISWKIYRPLNKENKFRQWNIDGVIEGMHNFKECDTLILNSSTKDRMVVKKALNNESYGFLNSTSENSFVNLIKNKSKLKAKRIIAMYDADDAGYNASVKIAEHLDCEYRDMRNKLDGQKDFSDYIDKQKGKHSLNNLKNLISNEISKI